MRVATWTVAVLVAVAVPGILVVNGFRLLATDTFVDWELGRDGFPPDLYGFDTEQRTALAKLGLRSIEPGSEGIVLLERATLPNGSPAFGARELTHMQDVRTLFGAALRVRYLLRQPEVAAEMGEKGYRHVRDNFLLTRHLREYLTLMLALERGGADRIELDPR